MKLLAGDGYGKFKTAAITLLLLAGGLTSILSGGSPIAAQPAGSMLDPSFGHGGKVTLDLGDPYEQASGLAIGPDGKIVVSVMSYQGEWTPDRFTLLRYNPDGRLDSTFGVGGRAAYANTAIGQDGGQLRDLTLQPDGKIVAAGWAFDPVRLHEVFAVARYNADGSFDDSFGNGGIVLTSVSAASDQDYGEAKAVTIAPDGKIVAAGYIGGSASQIAIARYNNDGTLDENFASAGVAHSDWGEHGQVYRVLAQSDGKIVLSGSSGWPGDFTVGRYNADGSPDASFGENGLVKTDFLGGHDWAYGLALGENGKIIAAGPAEEYCECDGSWAMGMVQYNADGTLDNTFGRWGKVFQVAGPLKSASVDSLVRRADGKLILAGSLNNEEFLVALYNPDGALDKSFGVGGIATADFGPDNDRAYEVALAPDGKIVLAGDTDSPEADELRNYNLALARFDVAPIAVPTTTPTATTTPTIDECAALLADSPMGKLFNGKSLVRYVCQMN